MPSTATDVIRGVSTSVAVKAPVRVAATSNIVLAGEQTISGVACVDGDRVLCVAQTDAGDNGIYVVSTGQWQRAVDFDGARDAVKGTLVLVNEAADGIGYELVTEDPEIGVTDLEFEVRDLDSSLRADLAKSTVGSQGSRLVGNRRSETGATATTLFEIVSRTVNVKDFGAVGDDSTDNAVPFANAMAAVINGDALRIPTGTYRMSSFPGLSSGVSLYGDGAWKTVLKYTGAAASIIKVANTASSNGYINLVDLAVLANNNADICVDFKSVSFGVISRCRLWGGTDFASKKATGVRLSAAASGCYQNIIEHSDLQSLSIGLSIEDGANENRLFGGAVLNCGDGVKTSGALSDNFRMAFVRVENCTDGVDIHNFRDYLIIGCRFEKNADGTRGIVIAGGSTSFAPLTLIQNHYSSYSAGNDLVTSGLTGRVERVGENASQYEEFTGNGVWHLGLGKLYVGSPPSGTEPIIEAEGLNANMNLELRPKGTGAVYTPNHFLAGKIALLDGVAAPSTIGGLAQIYVDTADGDLKIKFGDGTVKTIVVDT